MYYSESGATSACAKHKYANTERSTTIEKILVLFGKSIKVALVAHRAKQSTNTCICLPFIMFIIFAPTNLLLVVIRVSSSSARTGWTSDMFRSCRFARTDPQICASMKISEIDWEIIWSTRVLHRDGPWPCHSCCCCCCYFCPSLIDRGKIH